MKSAVIGENESERVALLKRYQILDTESEDDFNEIVQLASKICETPISLISLVDSDRQWFKAKVGLSVPQTERDVSFCAHALSQDAMMVVPDTSKDDRFFDNPLVTGDPHVGFYAGMPLKTESGLVLGTLCVIDHKPRNLNETQLLTLNILGKQVIKLLELRMKLIQVKESEAALKNSEDQINSIFQNTIDAVVVMNEEGVITQWNHMAEVVFGWTSHEIVGKHLQDTIIPIRFREEHEHGFKHYMENGDGPLLNRSIEMRALRKDNIEIDIALGISPILIKEHKFFIGFISDISERKSVADKLDKQKVFYENILDKLPTDIAVFDKNHRYLFVNPGAISNEEYRKFIIGKDDFEYCAYRNRDMSVAERRREHFLKVETTRKSIEWEDSMKDPNGRTITHLRKMFPVYDNQDELTMIIGFGIDITERKEAEEELIKAKNLAEQLTGSKDQFLANMSHEIRTPMNAILGMSHQLAKTSLDEKQQFYNDTISKAAENLLIIINDILDFSKIEAGKLSLEEIGFDISDVIDKAMQVMLYKAEEKGISITKSLINKYFSPVLIGDPYRINQVLLNLINNAIKFTDKGGVDISCECVSDTESAQRIRITVSDTGIGMDKEFVDRIFEKFTQEDVSVTRRFGGTGLGLSISKELVNLMGGEIKITSEKNKGSQISFELLFRKGKITDLPLSEELHINTQILANKKILVVDDNQMNRLLATAILNNYGAITLEALNGIEAVEALRKQSVDLVLMDIQMPVMDGVEATKIIREEISDSLPIIALTANAIKGVKEKYFAQGMNDYLSKPFTENELVSICVVSLGKDIKTIDFQKPVEIINNAALYNLSYLEEISRGDNEFLIKILELFIEQIPDSAIKINLAYQKGDMDTIKAVAHSMVSSIETLSITPLKNAIREIEKLAIQHSSGTAMEALLKQVSDYLPKVIAQIKDKIKDLEATK